MRYTIITCINDKCGTFTAKDNFTSIYEVQDCFCSEIKAKACWHNKHAPTLPHHNSWESNDRHMSQEADQNLWLLKHTPWPNAKHFSSIHPKTAGFWKNRHSNCVCSFKFPTDLYWHTPSQHKQPEKTLPLGTWYPQSDISLVNLFEKEIHTYFVCIDHFVRCKQHWSRNTSCFSL